MGNDSSGMRLWTLEKSGRRLKCQRSGPKGPELSVYLEDGLVTRRKFTDDYQLWVASIAFRQQFELEGWCDVFAPIKARSFWHAFDAESQIAAHNLLVSGGSVRAVSYERASNPSAAGASAPYEVVMTERQKEEVFEAVRVERFSACPTRLGSLFLFSDREDAEGANLDCWGGRRVILPARVSECVAFGEFDSKHLDHQSSEQWVAAAESYWSGVRTDAPRIEAVLCGTIELDGWEPYGRLCAPDPHAGTPRN